MNTTQNEDLKIEAQAKYWNFDYFYTEWLVRIWIVLWICVPLLSTFLLAITGKLEEIPYQQSGTIIYLYMFFMFLAVPFVGHWAEKKLFFLIYPKYKNVLKAKN